MIRSGQKWRKQQILTTSKVALLFGFCIVDALFCSGGEISFTKKKTEKVFEFFQYWKDDVIFEKHVMLGEHFLKCATKFYIQFSWNYQLSSH